VKVTRDGGRWSNADADRVDVVAYDPSWPELYEREARAIRAALPAGIDAAIHHIGSTAVPGLAAKPIIDVLLVVDAGAGWDRLVTPLESLDYVWWADNPRSDHMFFVKGMPPFGQRRTHHVHVHTPGPDVERRLLFRDALRSDPREARRYEDLKRELAARHATDRDAYTAAKGDFVAAVVARATRARA